MASFTGSGFTPGETIDIREPGQIVFTDREASDRAPVTQTTTADAVGGFTVDVARAGASATGRTSGRRYLRF